MSSTPEVNQECLRAAMPIHEEAEHIHHHMHGLMHKFPGFRYFNHTLKHMTKMSLLTKKLGDPAANHTEIMVELANMRNSMGEQAKFLGDTLERSQAELMRSNFMMYVFGAIALIAVMALVYLLRDEYRQSQLRKRGYGNVAT